VLFIPGLLPEHIGLTSIPIAATLPFSTVPPSSSSVSLPPNRVPIIRQLFTYGCPSRAPGDKRRLFSVLGTLLSSPLPDAERKRREAESRKLAGEAFFVFFEVSTDSITAQAKTESSPLIYILSPNQMIDNDYRLPFYISSSDHPIIPGVDPTDLPGDLAELLERSNGKPGIDLEVPPSTTSMTPNGKPNCDVDRQRGNVTGHEGWLETPKAEGPPPDGMYPVLAIDCEMVLSEDGQELARVSVIDYPSGVSVFDELVRPPKPVTDYRTQ